MKLSRPLTLGFAALCLVLALETFTNTDVWLQNYFYDSANMQWLINPLRHKELTVFFYDGMLPAQSVAINQNRHLAAIQPLLRGDALELYIGSHHCRRRQILY